MGREWEPYPVEPVCCLFMWPLDDWLWPLTLVGRWRYWSLLLLWSLAGPTFAYCIALASRAPLLAGFAIDPITLDPMPVNKHEGGNLLGIRQRLAPAQDPKKFGLTQLSGLLTFLDVSCCRPLGLSCSENNNNDSLL